MTRRIWIDPSLLDNHQQRKHRRVRAIADIIRRIRRIKYKLLLSELEYNGIRRKVAEEYIDILKEVGDVRVEDGYVVSNNGQSEDAPSESTV